MRKIRIILIFSIVLTLLLAMTALVSAVTAPYSLDYARSDAGIQPVLTISENTPKLNSLPGLAGFKFEETPVPGTTTHALGSGTLTIVLAADADGNVFIEKWEAAGVVIRAIMVKGGNGYLTYSYDGTTSADGHLYTPMTGRDFGNVSGISHISFFYAMIDVQDTADAQETSGQPTETDPLSDSITDSTTDTAGDNDPAGESTEESTVNLEGNDLPLASNPTDGSADSITETSCTTTVTLTGDAIPRTGENSSVLALTVGIVLLAMAAVLGLIVRKRRSSVK